MTGGSRWVRKAKELANQAEELEARTAREQLSGEALIAALREIAELRRQSREEEYGARLISVLQRLPFTKSKGLTPITRRRIEFLRKIKRKHDPLSYDDLAFVALSFGADHLWPDEDDLRRAVFNFAKRHRLLGQSGAE